MIRPVDAARCAIGRSTGWLARARHIIVPEFALRSRIAGVPQTEEDYRAAGTACVGAINRALGNFGKSVGDFAAVLDFGCGPARVLQHVHRLNPRQELHGSDIDPEAIAWCRSHIDYAAFEVNASLPPLAYPDGKFEFIYVLSVFSHLDREMQRAWLSEMARLLRPGAPLYLTFSGRFVFDKFREDFPAASIREFETSGFTFINNIGAEFYVYPKWYQTSLQEIRYFTAALPDNLRLIYYAARGHMEFQDAVLCVKQ